MRGTYERIVLGHDNRREDLAGLLKGQATLFDCHNYRVIFSRGSVSCCNARNKGLVGDLNSASSYLIG